MYSGRTRNRVIEVKQDIFNVANSKMLLCLCLFNHNIIFMAQLLVGIIIIIIIIIVIIIIIIIIIIIKFIIIMVIIGFFSSNYVVSL